MNELITTLLKEIGPGRMPSTAYDTAWAARLGTIDDDLGHNALEWLGQRQLDDGSWGAKEVLYYHDRVISTLAAMIALHQRGRRVSDRKLIEKGMAALEAITSNATRGLTADPNGATVGFEMIAPTLIDEAVNLGLIKQQGERILGRLGQRRAKKLERLGGKLVSRHLTLAFSSEMAGIDNQQMLDVENLQEKNGSVGHSPSATSYFALLVRPGDQKALSYLHKTQGADGGMPNVAPFDVFEIAWVLWNLRLIPGFVQQQQGVQKYIDFLSAAWKPGEGIAYAAQYSVRDSDETSMVLDVLSRWGIKKDIESLLGFEDNEHFRCYPMESDPSISANIHVLGALTQVGFPKNDPRIQKILQFLSRTKMGNYWVDKWHASPFYATTHAIIVCAGLDNEMVRESVKWLINSQRRDGSWGIFCPTAEETAYALQSLSIWDQKVAHVPKEIFVRGREWLKAHAQPPYPPIWIGKCLYSPEWVIQSAVVSALCLTE